MMAIAELQTIMRENPDVLLDADKLNDYGSRLAGRKIAVVLLKSGTFRYAPDGLDEQLAGQLPVYRLGRGETYKFREESFESDGRWIAGFQYAFRFGDQSPGNLFLLLNAGPVGKLANRLLPSAALSILSAFLAASALLTVWMSRRILRPIRQLRQAAEQIKEGHLDHPVDMRGKDELAQLGHAFEEMRRRLHESVRERLKIEENRKQLIANLSHDLKTPITAIMGYVEGMLDGVAATPERMEKYAKTIRRHAMDLDRLIDELFLYSKLDLNRVPFRFVEFDLLEYVDGITEELKLQMENRGIRLEVERPDGPVWVQADPEQLKRVFSNVIGNSIKYMDKEEKRILLRMAPDKEAGMVRIEIYDNGAGIDGRDLPHVFDRFYRAETSRHKDNGGNGLGLAIASQIVEAHGGIIRAESEWGKGTVVTFTLKAADRPD